jgi:hypothetical protein
MYYPSGSLASETLDPEVEADGNSTIVWVNYSALPSDPGELGYLTSA